MVARSPPKTKAQGSSPWYTDLSFFFFFFLRLMVEFTKMIFYLRLKEKSREEKKRLLGRLMEFL